MATLAVLGTLDTKGPVYRFLGEALRARGFETLLIDVGLRGEPQVEPDISREDVLGRTGLDPARLEVERGAAANVMGRCAAALLSRLYLDQKVEGVIASGGRCGVALATAAMRALPVGVPCVLVSHVSPAAAGVDRGCKDILWVRSLVEIDGINRVANEVLLRGAGALAGMVEYGAPSKWNTDRPIIVASCFGPTGLGYEKASRILRDAGYDVVPFTEKGRGGKVMESILSTGTVAGVLDISTTDIADQVAGGVLSCGEQRMEACTRRSIPAVIAPGGVDVVHFNQDSVPERYWGRNLLERDSAVLMRTSEQECRSIGDWIAEKLNRFIGPVTLCLPLRGLSGLSAPGKPFHDPSADFALFERIQKQVRSGVKVIKVPTTTEEVPFAEACAFALLENIRRMDEERNLLRQVAVFRLAGDMLLSQAARFAEPKSFADGEYLQREDAPVDSICIITRGAAEVLNNGERTEKLGAGAVVGEDCFLLGIPQGLSVRALRVCEVLRLRRSMFDQLRRRYPELERSVALARAARAVPPHPADH